MSKYQSENDSESEVKTNDDLSAAWTESPTASKSINIHLDIQYPWDSSIQCFWSDALSCFNSYPGNFTCKIKKKKKKTPKVNILISSIK